MAAITKSEVISLALTRNLSTEHILDSDIDVAVKMYVDAYINDVTYETTYYDDYVKPVIAFGVIVNIFNRIATEITDRGIVQMVNDGAQSLDTESKNRTLNEYQMQLNHLIELMVDEADEADLVDTFDYDLVGYTGIDKMGVL
jgi:hypothetical protein